MKINLRIFFAGIVVFAFMILGNHLLGIFAGEKYMDFLANYLSRDGVISCKSCVLLNADRPILFIALLWVILFIALAKFNLQEFTWFHIRQLPLELKITWLSFFILTMLWIICKFMSFFPELYMEDFMLENLTAILLLNSSLLLLVKMLHPARYNPWILLLGALVFFVVGMEEISWGQRIFGWETPATLSAFNYQNETNLHNVLNPILTQIYVVSNFVLGCVFLFANEIRSFLSRFSWHKIIAPFLPSNQFIWLGFIFLFLSLQRFWFGDELTEQVFSVIGQVSTWNILREGRPIRIMFRNTQTVG